MNFKVNCQSVVTDAAREVARIEFVDEKYAHALKANIEQNAEKLSLFDDLELAVYTKDFSKLTKQALVARLNGIKYLVETAARL